MSGSAEGATVGREAQAAVTLDGDGLRGAFEAATRCLERQRDAINALNVFPVPDGDTGTNMLLTMRAINEEALRASDSSVGAVAAAMARGALLGARGNSGVILSQFFHGMAQGLQGKDELDGGGPGSRLRPGLRGGIWVRQRARRRHHADSHARAIGGGIGEFGIARGRLGCAVHMARLAKCRKRDAVQDTASAPGVGGRPASSMPAGRGL